MVQASPARKRCVIQLLRHPLCRPWVRLPPRGSVVSSNYCVIRCVVHGSGFPRVEVTVAAATLPHVSVEVVEIIVKISQT